MNPWFIADAHSDTLYAAMLQRRDWTERTEVGHADLIRLMETPIHLQVLALFSDPNFRRDGFTAKCLEMIGTFRRGQERAKNRGLAVDLIRSRQELGRATELRSGFRAILSIEGGEALSGSIGVLEAFYLIGVRSLGLVWNLRNELADGVSEASSEGGLTRFGRDVVRKMNEWGMAIDVSHLSPRGFWDVIRESKKPVFASHSNAYTLCPHPRNLTNDQLKAIAAAGGVIGINFYPDFLTESAQATIVDVVHHIEYVADLVGLDHVAIGSDFDGIDRTPEGLDDVTHLPRLIDALLDRGFSANDVEKVLGMNLVHFFHQVLPDGSEIGDT